MHATFLAALGPTPPWSPQAQAELERSCAALLERGAKAHAGIPAEVSTLLASLARKVADALSPAALHWDDVREALEALDIEGLYLAASCAGGHPAAIQRFEALYFRGLAPALRSMGAQAADIDDVVAVVREKLFVAPPGETARVVEFAGRGSLDKLCRVIAIRTLLNRRRSSHAERLSDDRDLADIITAQTDPEMAAVKQHHRDAFRQAFAEAIATLSSEERNMLRLSLIHRLSVDEVGRIFRIHRSTAARRLGRIRDCLAQRTRVSLRDRLGADRRELQSLFRLVRSGLDNSFVRLLDAPAA